MPINRGENRRGPEPEDDKIYLVHRESGRLIAVLDPGYITGEGKLVIKTED